jgi:tetratricopeptide (TPR) repeat protein
MGAVTTEFLSELQNLTKDEKTTIQKFQTDPTGASFVPVADLLRKRGYIEEAIVVLEDGVQNYPQYSSARAALARDYYSQGMFDESLQATESVLSTAPDNTLAQRINLKLLVLMDRREEAMVRLKNIARAVPDDALTAAIRKAIAVNDWPSAQRWVRSDLEKLGVYADFELPQDQQHSDMSLSEDGQPSRDDRGGKESPSWAIPSDQRTFPPAGTQVSERAPFEGTPGGTSLDENGNLRHWVNPTTPDRQGADLFRPKMLGSEAQKNTAAGLPEALRSGTSLGHTEGDADRYLLLRGFRRFDSRGYFIGRDQRTSRFAGIEKQTIAEIYREQGMQMKALEIYEKLIREEPNNISYQQNYQTIKKEVRQLLLQEELAEDTPPPKTPADALEKDSRAPQMPPLREASAAEVQNSDLPKNEIAADRIVEASERKIEILKSILGKLDTTKDQTT